MAATSAAAEVQQTFFLLLLLLLLLATFESDGAGSLCVDDEVELEELLSFELLLPVLFGVVFDDTEPFLPNDDGVEAAVIAAAAADKACLGVENTDVLV